MIMKVSDFLSQVKALSPMELDDISPEPSILDIRLIGFLNIVLRKRARQAYQLQFSDPLSIYSEGYQVFTVSGEPITDMYEPLAIYDASDQQAPKRTSFDGGGKGWIRESPNLGIHTRSMNGEYKLKYIKYPREVMTTNEDLDQFPPAGYWDLLMDVISLVKLPKNFYQEAEAMSQKATGTATVKAAIAARGTNSAPPSMEDREG